jgi:hypothetical protein
LDSDRTFDRGDNAGKLRKRSIANQLENTPAVGFDRGIEDGASVGLQAFKRPAFMCRHKGRIADNVGGQNGG